MPAQTSNVQKSSQEVTAKKHEEKLPKPQDALTSEGAVPSADLQRAVTDPRTARPPEILALQHTYGNRAVQRLLADHTIQAKLNVGAADHPLERQADRVAKEVMEGDLLQAKPLAASITPLIQRQSIPEEEEEEPLQRKFIQRQAIPEEDEEPLQGKFIQRQTITEEEDEEPLQAKPRDPQAGFEASAKFQSDLEATQGAGEPLPPDTLDFMEKGFGAGFSHVRVHTGPASKRLCSQINAQAFTCGPNVYLGPGKNVQCKPLLAHELTHVLQQGAASPSPTVQAKANETPDIQRDQDPHERLRHERNAADDRAAAIRTADDQAAATAPGGLLFNTFPPWKIFINMLRKPFSRKYPVLDQHYAVILCGEAAAKANASDEELLECAYSAWDHPAEVIAIIKKLFPGMDEEAFSPGSESSSTGTDWGLSPQDWQMIKKALDPVSMKAFARGVGPAWDAIPTGLPDALATLKALKPVPTESDGMVGAWHILQKRLRTMGPLKLGKGLAFDPEDLAAWDRAAQAGKIAQTAMLEASEAAEKAAALLREALADAQREDSTIDVTYLSGWDQQVKLAEEDMKKWQTLRTEAGIDASRWEKRAPANNQKDAETAIQDYKRDISWAGEIHTYWTETASRVEAYLNGSADTVKSLPHPKGASPDWQDLPIFPWEVTTDVPQDHKKTTTDQKGMPSPRARAADEGSNERVLTPREAADKVDAGEEQVSPGAYAEATERFIKKRQAEFEAELEPALPENKAKRVPIIRDETTNYGVKRPAAPKSAKPDAGSAKDIKIIPWSEHIKSKQPRDGGVPQQVPQAPEPAKPDGGVPQVPDASIKLEPPKGVPVSPEPAKPEDKGFLRKMWDGAVDGIKSFAKTAWDWTTKDVIKPIAKFYIDKIKIPIVEKIATWILDKLIPTENEKTGQGAIESAIMKELERLAKELKLPNEDVETFRAVAKAAEETIVNLEKVAGKVQQAQKDTEKYRKKVRDLGGSLGKVKEVAAKDPAAALALLEKALHELKQVIEEAKNDADKWSKEAEQAVEAVKKAKP